MENITGLAVTAGNYLDTRRYLVDELRKLLLQHSVLIEAPRRFGKTSLVKEFERQEKEKGEGSRFHVLFLELEGVTSLNGFCQKLYQGLIELYVLRRCGDWVISVVQRSWEAVASRIARFELPELGVELRDATRTYDFTTWKERIHPLLAGLDRVGKRVVIAVDEFPDMLVNFAGKDEPLDFKEATDALTAWLRSVRQEQQGGNCSFLFCGSINLRKTLEEVGLGKRMNDVETLRVPPMAPEEAISLLRTLAGSYGILLEPAALDFMVDKTADGPPYFGQILIKALRDSRRSEISLRLLEGIYDSMLRNGDHDLNHFDTRLDDYLKSQQEVSCSRAILRTLCNDKWHERELFDFAIAEARMEYAAYLKIVDRLIYEGYLTRDIQDAGKLSFVSPLLRDWWACRAGVR